MPRIAQLMAVFLGLVLAAAVADGSPSRPAADPLLELWLDDLAASRREHAHALAASPEAHGKLAGALLAYFDDFEVRRVEPTSEAQRWLDAAVALAPDDPLIAWAQVHACTGAAACRRDAALERLQRLEPDNALVWMVAAGAAGSAGRDAERALLEQRMLEADGYANPYLALARTINAAWRDIPLPPSDAALRAKLGERFGLDLSAGDEALAQAHGYWAMLAFGIPSYQPLVQACVPHGRPAIDAERRGRCIALFERVAADEDLLFGPMLGLSILIKLHDDDPMGQAHWREAYRRFLWHYEEASRLLLGLPVASVAAGPYGQRFIREGEVAAMRGLLRQHGIPLDPPADWLPSDPRRRLLVTEGRELDD